MKRLLFLTVFAYLLIGCDNNTDYSGTNDWSFELPGCINFCPPEPTPTPELESCTDFFQQEVLGHCIYAISKAQELSSLDGLETVNRNVALSGMTNDNLLALENLTTIHGHLFIQNNPELTSLEGLKNLSHVSGQLVIQNNGVLANLSGLENLRHVESLTIISNGALTNFDALGGLEEVRNGEITINHNPSLVSLFGLSGVRNVENLTIQSNNNLENLIGLENIENLTDLSVSSNAILKSMWGGDVVDGLVNVSINDNPLLSDLSPIFDSSKIISVDIKNNAEPLVVPSDRSGITLEKLQVQNVDGLFNPSFNQNFDHIKELDLLDYDKIDFNLLYGISVETLVINFAQNLMSLDGLNVDNLTSIELAHVNSLVDASILRDAQNLQLFSLNNAAQLESIDIFSMSAPLIDIHLSGLSRIEDLSGLEFLTDIYSLRITDCESLVSLNGLNNLRSVSNIFITANNSLNDISALDELTSVDETFVIRGSSICESDLNSLQQRLDRSNASNVSRKDC